MSSASQIRLILENLRNPRLRSVAFEGAARARPSKVKLSPRTRRELREALEDRLDILVSEKALAQTAGAMPYSVYRGLR